MKKYVIIIIVLVVLGALVFISKGKKLEAPVVTESPVVNEIVNTEPKSDSSDEKVAPSVKEFTISGKNFSFNPSTITVKKGDRVKITFNNTEGFHDFVISEFGAATKQAKSPATEVIEFTADKAGSFEYYCSVGAHRSMGMKGTLVVE
jgi:plastocyanin